jgi:hypothetical protein
MVRVNWRVVYGLHEVSTVTGEAFFNEARTKETWEC